MAGNWKKRGLAVVVALVVIYAWINGGEEELRVITVPVAIPGVGA